MTVIKAAGSSSSSATTTTTTTTTRCKTQQRLFILLLLPALLILNKHTFQPREVAPSTSPSNAAAAASRPRSQSAAPSSSDHEDPPTIVVVPLLEFDRRKERRAFVAQRNQTTGRHRPFERPSGSNRIYDILFVGCYLPRERINSATAQVPNKGDYMYRDAWLEAFSSTTSNKINNNKNKNKNIHVTHQVEFDKARDLVEQSKFVVFGGGGLIYNSLGRKNGTAILEIFTKWHLLLQETKTPYAFGSIGLQPSQWGENVDTETLDFETLDGGLFKMVQPFIRDAVFITCRSPSDQQLFAQWNPYSYYYPDLCFTLKKIGLAHGSPPAKRNLLLTVGRVASFQEKAAELTQILGTGHYIHHHLVTSQDDVADDGNFTDLGLAHEPEWVVHSYLQQDDAEFAAAAYVYTSRYHGFVMAMLNDVPHVVRMLSTWKLSTFAYHEGSDNLQDLALQHVEMIRDIALAKK